MSIRTLLIGLDGATFSVLDPLMHQGVMPFLQSFFAGGVRAGLRTIVPPLTPPAWTSLMTGRTPGNHGVFDFFRMDSPASRHIRFFNSNDVQCDTIWSLASAGGLRTTTINFPAMFPPPHISGYVVPGWVPWKQLRLACWPEGLFEKLKAIPGFNQRELAMDIKMEEKATEGTSNHAELGPWIELHTRREQNLFQVLQHLTQEDPSELTAVLFDGVDKLQHLCWRYLRPEDDRPLTEEWEHQIRQLCLQYFCSLDSLLRQLCELAGPEATVLLASDHGFGPTYDVLHINTWLEQHGYLAWSEAAHSRDTEGALLGVGQVAKHTWLMDWNKTKAFATTPTSNGIYIVVSDGTSPGVPAAEYPAFIHKLSGELRQIPDLHTGQPLVSEIWTREKAFQGPHADAAPDLTLILRDGGLVSILPSTEAVTRRPVVSGSHRPVGIFGARGPGLRRGFHASELSILDIASTTLYTLGLSIPEGLQGRVPEEIYQDTFFETHPIRRVAAGASTAATRAGNAPPPTKIEDEEVVLERLRELGYIE
jgi:predicted AlkP superfamily phosphohydrolase/phosphomutase